MLRLKDMTEFFKRLDDRTYKCFHSIWVWLIIATLLFITWYFKSTLGGFIVILLVCLTLVFFQSDVKLFGIILMLGYMSLNEMPFFDTISPYLYGMIITGCLGGLLLYLKRAFIIKKAQWSFGPVGFSLTLLVAWGFLSSVINQFTSTSKYLGYGYIFGAICLIMLLMYLGIASGGERNDKTFVVKTIYIINILLMAQSFTNMIVTQTVVAGFYLGWGTKNLVAMTLEFCIPFLAYIYSKNFKRIDAIVFIIVDYILIILSESRGASISIAYLTVLVAFIISYNTKAGKLRWTLLITSGNLVAFCFALRYPSDLQEAIIRVFTMGDNLSGREEIWEQAMYYFNASPIIGGSYSCLFDIYEYFQTIWEGTFNPGVVGVMLCHNNFVTIIAALGVVGVLIFAFNMFETVYTSFMCKDKAYAWVLIYVILFSFSHGMVDNTFYSVQYMIPYIIIFADPSLPSFGDYMVKNIKKKQTPASLD